MLVRECLPAVQLPVNTSKHQHLLHDSACLATRQSLTHSRCLFDDRPNGDNHKVFVLHMSTHEMPSVLSLVQVQTRHTPV